MIGIIGAMEMEVDGLIDWLDGVKTAEISGITYYEGLLSGKSVVVACSGIGKVQSAICTQSMIMMYKPECIINTGVAGGIGKDVKIGDAVIASAVVQHDFDLSPLGDPIGMLPKLGVIEIPCDVVMSDKLFDSVKLVGGGKAPFRGVIASGDQFVSDKEKSVFIADEFHALACEMESASIGYVCYVNNVSFGILRTISDSANDDAKVDFPAFAKETAEKAIEIIKHFVLNY